MGLDSTRPSGVQTAILGDLSAVDIRPNGLQPSPFGCDPLLNEAGRLRPSHVGSSLTHGRTYRISGRLWLWPVA